MGIDPRKRQKQMMDALAQAQQVQQQVAEETVEASAGGGLVVVKANGAGEIVEIRIDPKASDPDDPRARVPAVVPAGRGHMPGATEDDLICHIALRAPGKTDWDTEVPEEWARFSLR